MECDFTCKTCGRVKGGVLDRRVKREWGDTTPLTKEPDADTCGYYNGAPDPKTRERFTKPKEVIEGAECFHYLPEDKAETMHLPNYWLP